MFEHHEPHYDVAQVCERGHVVNGSTQEHPEHNRPFCRKCGQKTLTACPRCGEPIQGQFQGYVPVVSMDEDEAPAFCHACGRPYPWTAEGIDTAKTLASELEGLTEDERLTINASIDDLVIDSPRTSVAVLRFKKIIAKSRGAARELLLDLIAKIAVESAKTGLGG